MKLLRGTLKPSVYQVGLLVNPEGLDLLHLENIGEMPEGLDFAILWKCVWREGRYGDAQCLLPHDGLQTPVPDFALEPKRLLELAITYARELGYRATQPGEIVDLNTIIQARESTEDAMLTEKRQPPVVITISLYSIGDIRLPTSSKSFLTTRFRSYVPLPD